MLKLILSKIDIIVIFLKKAIIAIMDLIKKLTNDKVKVVKKAVKKAKKKK